jgi:hypothetical protein
LTSIKIPHTSASSETALYGYVEARLQTLLRCMGPELPGRTMARTGLRMIADVSIVPPYQPQGEFPRYGWKAGVSGGTFLVRRSA